MQEEKLCSSLLTHYRCDSEYTYIHTYIHTCIHTGPGVYFLFTDATIYIYIYTYIHKYMHAGGEVMQKLTFPL